MNPNAESEDFDGPNAKETGDSGGSEITEGRKSNELQAQDFEIAPKLCNFEIDEAKGVSSHLSEAGGIEPWKPWSPIKAKIQQGVVYWGLCLYTAFVLIGLIVFVVTKDFRVLAVLAPGILALLKKIIDYLLSPPGK